VVEVLGVYIADEDSVVEDESVNGGGEKESVDLDSTSESP
jgi:hypothetical protein